MASQRLNIPYISSAACKKRQHKTVEAAKEHLLHVEARNQVFGFAKSGPLHVYLCPSCHYFHVGHQQVQKGKGHP
jgi:hypothetical protein